MLRFFVRILARTLLALRYKIEIKGLDTLTKKEGICFFPNHPSELDAVVLLTLLGKDFKPRPIVVETVYEIPFLQTLMRLIGAIPIPDFDLGGNDYTRLLAKRALNNIVDLLNKGSNILLYPSGHLKRGPKEEVRGASGAFDIVKQASGMTLVLVRTEGLWGSIFSLARTESSQQILWTLLKAAGLLAQNLLFFAPRRSVKVEFYEAPRSFYTYAAKEGFNKALEEWYNKPFGPEGEPLNLVRETFWSSKIPRPLERKAKTIQREAELPDDVKKKVITEVAYIAKRKAEEISLEHSLTHDVGLDSLDIITLISYLEEEFTVKHLVPQDLDTVYDAVYLAAHKREPKNEEAIPVNGWPSLEERLRPTFPEGHTLVEVFLKNCDRRGPEPACADLMTGRVLTYEQAKLAVIILSRQFRKLPEKKIAVMLPATSTAYLVVLALMLAGKTPVMLNWTLGRFVLNEALAVAGCLHIITSKKFVRFAKTMDLEGIDDKLLFLEELKISLFAKVRGWIASKRATEELIANAPLTDESHAVILFTSGSESTPKAVPLTHKNILSNLRAAYLVVHFHKDDVLLGFLPPFHSFGFGVTGLMPLLSGLLVLFAPDPTDSFRLAQSLDRWQVTFLCGAPTFLRALLHALQRGQGKALRLIVTGAEKAPPALYKEVAAKVPQALLIEGYGITECSPILTLNPPGEKARGVGRALPTVEIAIADLATTRLLPQGEEGIILAHGPNIFSGYLSHSVNRPFVSLDGKKWYITGDLGHLDDEGGLWLSGRLKRFVKMGGEMINLLTLEETLTEGVGVSDTPYLAVIAHEKENERPELILFTTKTITIDEANRILRNKKIAHLAKISEVILIDEMPLLGTGKVNTRALEEKIHK